MLQCSEVVLSVDFIKLSKLLVAQCSCAGSITCYQKCVAMGVACEWCTYLSVVEGSRTASRGKYL